MRIFAERVKIMKKIAVLFLSLIILFSFSGCYENNELSPDDPVTLNMWHVYGSQTKSPLNDAIDEFNATVGKQEGIIINVVSVTSSSAIDSALYASANNEPGADELPDLFTAYPRVAEIVGKEKLLCWDDYFTEEELSAFSEDFITEGYFDSELLMLPVAKSSEVFYVNKTLFDRFSEASGMEYSDLSCFDGIFDTAKLYYDMTGSDFVQINDYYHYFLLGMKSTGNELICDGKINCQSPEFYELWYSLADCAIHGGLCLEDGYAAARWKTAEVISNIGSTADILYQPKAVFYPDNTSEEITSVSFPYPSFDSGENYTTYRGGGLFAIRSEDQKKNKACYIFAKWLTEKQNNLDFATKSGYLPVTKDGLSDLLTGEYSAANKDFQGLYNTVGEMSESHKFVALPLFDGASELQRNFETNIKYTLKSAKNQYNELIANGEEPQQAKAMLIESSFNEFKALCIS